MFLVESVQFTHFGRNSHGKKIHRAAFVGTGVIQVLDGRYLSISSERFKLIAIAPHHHG